MRGALSLRAFPKGLSDGGNKSLDQQRLRKQSDAGILWPGGWYDYLLLWRL